MIARQNDVSFQGSKPDEVGTAPNWLETVDCSRTHLAGPAKLVKHMLRLIEINSADYCLAGRLAL